MTKAVVDEIKKMTTDVVSDRKFCNAMTCYVQEKKRDLFSVTVFEGKAQFRASPKIGKVMEDHPEVMELLKGVFQKQLAVEKDDLEEPELKVFGDVSLPLLFAPFMKI